MSEAAREFADEPAGWPAEPAADAARREHALQSLLEIGHELTVSLDLYGMASLVLLNLMGQFGTGRSALWLLSDDPTPGPVLVRCHGFARGMMEAVGTACEPALRTRFATQPSAVLTWALRDSLGPSEFELARQAEIALFMPLCGRGEVLGWIALGPRVDGSQYEASALVVLEAAAGMVGVALHNTRLYNQLLEGNRRLRVTNEHLQELDRAKSQFLSNVNHELRTPLAVVIAALECVLGRDTLEPDIQKLLEAALGRSQDLRRLVENLLMFSDAAAGRLASDVQVGDAGAVVEAFFADRLPGVTAGLYEMTCEVEPRLPPARFDRQCLGRILDELVDNALKFTPRGTHLRLSAARCEQEGQTCVRVELSDDGPGIPPDRMDALFSPFEQVDGSTTRRVGGLGIGLAFVRELAWQMRAELDAKSTVGHGTSFSLFLPVA